MLTTGKENKKISGIRMTDIRNEKTTNSVDVRMMADGMNRNIVEVPR